MSPGWRCPQGDRALQGDASRGDDVLQGDDAPHSDDVSWGDDASQGDTPWGDDAQGMVTPQGPRAVWLTWARPARSTVAVCPWAAPPDVPSVPGQSRPRAPRAGCSKSRAPRGRAGSPWVSLGTHAASPTAEDGGRYHPTPGQTLQLWLLPRSQRHPCTHGCQLPPAGPSLVTGSGVLRATAGTPDRPRSQGEGEGAAPACPPGLFGGHFAFIQLKARNKARAGGAGSRRHATVTVAGSARSLWDMRGCLFCCQGRRKPNSRTDQLWSIGGRQRGVLHAHALPLLLLLGPAAGMQPAQHPRQSGAPPKFPSQPARWGNAAMVPQGPGTGCCSPVPPQRDESPGTAGLHLPLSSLPASIYCSERANR